MFRWNKYFGHFSILKVVELKEEVFEDKVRPTAASGNGGRAGVAVAVTERPSFAVGVAGENEVKMFFRKVENEASEKVYLAMLLENKRKRNFSSQKH